MVLAIMIPSMILDMGMEVLDTHTTVLILPGIVLLAIMDLHVTMVMVMDTDMDIAHGFQVIMLEETGGMTLPTGIATNIFFFFLIPGKLMEPGEVVVVQLGIKHKEPIQEVD